jgi:hypothetical protein
VKKGLVPKHMGKITEVQWKEFVQQKIDLKALAISNEYDEISKKNIYPHHMGSKGYVGKISEWKKKIEEAVSAGNTNPVEDKNRELVTRSVKVDTRRQTCPQEERSCRSSKKGSTTH